MGIADLPEPAATVHASKILIRVALSQQCAVFVVRHANARTMGIRDVNARRPCFTASC
jgi:hypothetical protein